MNERIKELSKEAFEYALSQHPGSDEFQPIWTEKFAELIVRECINMSTDLKAEYLSARKQETDFSVKNIYTEGEAACDTLKYMMKKHFGVE